jgi:non-heme chloroperoxidase
MPTLVTSDRVSIHYTDTGAHAGTAEGGATVVLVAGFLASAATWLLQAEALEAAGHRVVAIDRRSHGLSEAPDHGQRIARHARDLEDVLDQLDLDDVVAVGASMGASTWWSYVDLFGTARLRGLVSVDQTPRMLNADGWENGFYGYVPENAGTYFDGVIPETGRGADPSATMRAVGLLVERLGPDVALMGQLSPQTQPLLLDHALQDWRDVIARTDVPVLMVAGSESQFWPSEHAVWAAAAAPYGRAAVIDGAGHAVNLDDAEGFNRVLLDFVGGIADGDPA